MIPIRLGKAAVEENMSTCDRAPSDAQDDVQDVVRRLARTSALAQKAGFS
jgi:hypothetical protein